MNFKLSRVCYFTELFVSYRISKGDDVGKKAGRRSPYLQVVLVHHADLMVHRVQLLLLWLQPLCVLCLLPAVLWLAPVVQDTCQKCAQARIVRGRAKPVYHKKK